jgi:hypothetical protein
MGEGFVKGPEPLADQAKGRPWRRGKCDEPLEDDTERTPQPGGLRGAPGRLPLETVAAEIEPKRPGPARWTPTQAVSGPQPASTVVNKSQWACLTQAPQPQSRRTTESEYIHFRFLTDAAPPRPPLEGRWESGQHDHTDMHSQTRHTEARE